MLKIDLTNNQCPQQLLCAICGNLLTAPIMLISTIGNVCHSCYDQDFKNPGKVIHGEGEDQVTVDVGNQKAAIRNISLEEIMKAVECRCKYSSKGCQFKSDVVSVQDHESICHFREITCVLFGCQWKGMEFEYLEHLFSCNHDDSTRCSRPEDVTIFPLDAIDIQEPTEAIYLLNTVSGVILLHFKLNLKQIHCAVFKVENYYEETYNIELVFKSNKNIIVSFECCIVNKIETFKNFYEKEESRYDFNSMPIDSLKQPVNVDIRLRHNIYGHFYNSLVPSLCQEENNHPARSLCKFANLGCCVFLLEDDLSNHEFICKYKNTWICLFCEYRGDFFPIVRTHKITNHQEKIDVINSNISEVIFDKIEEPLTVVKTVIAFNMFFTIHYKSDYRYLIFNVRQNGVSFGPVNQFLFEISLLDTKLHQSLVLKGHCIKRSGDVRYAELEIERSFLKQLFSSLENIDVISVKIFPSNLNGTRK